MEVSLGWTLVLGQNVSERTSKLDVNPADLSQVQPECRHAALSNTKVRCRCVATLLLLLLLHLHLHPHPLLQRPHLRTQVLLLDHLHLVQQAHPLRRTIPKKMTPRRMTPSRPSLPHQDPLATIKRTRLQGAIPTSERQAPLLKVPAPSRTAEITRPKWAAICSRTLTHTTIQTLATQKIRMTVPTNKISRVHLAIEMWVTPTPIQAVPATSTSGVATRCNF